MVFFDRIWRMVDLPVLGPLLYRLNVNRIVVRYLAAGHVTSIRLGSAAIGCRKSSRSPAPAVLPSHRLLARLADGEICVSELAELEDEKITTVSARLKTLHAVRLVKRRREAKHIHYAL